MQKQLLILESRYRTNTQDTNGSEYKFKLKTNININGTVRLEQFIFQNSQYTFSADKKSNKFVFTSNTGVPTTITIQGKFDTIDDFVKRFNVVTAGLNITMIYHLILLMNKCNLYFFYDIDMLSNYFKVFSVKPIDLWLLHLDVNNLVIYLKSS